MWNEFMRKQGWNDELSETLESEKKGSHGFQVGDPDDVSIH